MGVSNIPETFSITWFFLLLRRVFFDGVICYDGNESKQRRNNAETLGVKLSESFIFPD